MDKYAEELQTNTREMLRMSTRLQFHKPSAGAIINTPLHDIIVLLSRRMVRERLQ